MNDRPSDPRHVEYITRLRSLDPGDRARLKRNAGNRLAEARGATGLFYRLMPAGIPNQQEEIYFLVACLFPLAEEGSSSNLGASFREVSNDRNRKGIERRLEVLMDADLEQLPFRLRQAIHFLQSNRAKVNWIALLSDLLNWTHPDRFVQRNWARTYYVN